jgi:hypothetical protein
MDHTSVALLTFFTVFSPFLGACADSADSVDEPNGATSSALASGTPPPPPHDPPVVPIYRGNNPQIGDHVQGTVANEGAPGWIPEGIGFHIFGDGGPRFVPLLRCRVNGNGHHFLSTDPACEGQMVEGALGFVAPTPQPGVSAQLFRCMSPGGSDHLTTVHPEECAAAHYVIEGPQGFCAP